MNIFFFLGGGGGVEGVGWGYDETVDILGVIAKLDYFWELFLNILGFFL